MLIKDLCPHPFQVSEMVQEEVQEIHGSVYPMATAQVGRAAPIIGARTTNHLVLLSLHAETLCLNGTNISDEPCDASVSSTALYERRGEPPVRYSNSSSFFPSFVGQSLQVVCYKLLRIVFNHLSNLPELLQNFFFCSS